MKKYLFTISSILLLCALQVSDVIAWGADRTHRAITKKAVERSVLAEDYLEDFAKQFKQAPAANLKLIKAGKTKETEIVDIAGAIVSSEAVVKIINNSITQIKEQMQKKGLIDNGK